MKIIIILFLVVAADLLSMNSNIDKGERFCKQGKIDSALYYLNLVGDEVTIETSVEDVFYKNYFTAKCYDQLEANKSAEYYYLKSLRIMDSSGVSETDIYLNLADFYERILNYKGSNKYLRTYYSEHMEVLNEEINITREQVSHQDSLLSQLDVMGSENVKLGSDIRLLIVLIVVFGLAFFTVLILLIRHKKTSAKLD